MTVIPLNKPPNKKQAQAIIRDLAAKGRVGLSAHAGRQAKKRKISMLQILNCLSVGFVLEEPFQTLTYQGWETSVEGTVAGEKLKVVVCLRWSQDMLVITCYDL